jgi:hypothetical protein
MHRFLGHMIFLPTRNTEPVADCGAATSALSHYADHVKDLVDDVGVMALKSSLLWNVRR